MTSRNVVSPTEEELARWEPCHVPRGEHSTICLGCDLTWPCATARLIAALRAARRERDMAREEIAWLREHWIPCELPRSGRSRGKKGEPGWRQA